MSVRHIGMTAVLTVVILSIVSLAGAQGQPDNTPPPQTIPSYGYPTPRPFIPRVTGIDGTWSGDIFVSSGFPPPFFKVVDGRLGDGNIPGVLTNSVSIPILANQFCSGFPAPPQVCAVETDVMIVSLNLPSGAVLMKSQRNSITLNLSSDSANITGTLTSSSNTTGTVEGVAVSDNFFLLSLAVNEPQGQCTPTPYQGQGSIMPSTPNVLVFTLSGSSADCSQQFVRGRVTLQQ